MTSVSFLLPSVSCARPLTSFLLPSASFQLPSVSCALPPTIFARPWVFSDPPLDASLRIRIFSDFVWGSPPVERKQFVYSKFRSLSKNKNKKVICTCEQGCGSAMIKSESESSIFGLMLDPDPHRNKCGSETLEDTVYNIYHKRILKYFCTGTIHTAHPENERQSKRRCCFPLSPIEGRYIYFSI